MVLYECDKKHIQLVSLWVPRELNEFPDNLSHLSRYVGRQEVRGQVRDQSAPEGAGGSSGAVKEQSGKRKHIR